MNIFKLAYVINENFIQNIKDNKKVIEESQAIEKKAKAEGKIFIQYLMIDRELKFMGNLPKTEDNKKMLEAEVALLEKNIKSDKYLKEQLSTANSYKKGIKEILVTYK